MSYDEAEHRKRFASWCASTAASRSPKCRFTVREGFQIVESSGLAGWAHGWASLPDHEEFDARHREMREWTISAATKILGKNHGFTHGVAAKLINCFLKALYGTATSVDLNEAQIKKRNALHPPIDRLLMDGLLAQGKCEAISSRRETWQLVVAPAKGWSSLSSKEYEKVVLAIKEVTEGELWRIEQYWPGQS